MFFSILLPLVVNKHVHKRARRQRRWTRLTDARCDGRTTLLVAASAAIAREPGDTVLARALTGRLVARLVQRTDRVTVASYTHQPTQTKYTSYSA